MPEETKQAVEWALQQTWVGEFGEEYTITKDHSWQLVDKVREYFNHHDVEYSTFSYADLEPYLEVIK